MTKPINDSTFRQELLAENDRWLRMALYARLRDRHDVDEVMQEVAVAVMRKGDSLRDPAKAAPWLYRIAIRQALLFRRKCGRRRALTQRYFELSKSSPDFESDGTDWLMATERNAMVRQAMDKLPSRDAELLMLKYCERWSYRQMADKLGVSISAIESRLHRARKRLRTRLTAMGAVEVS